MPYKEKNNYQPKSRRKKPGYKVVNWSDYNKSLKKRGAISLYFPKGDLVSNFINEEPYVQGISGKQVIYKPAFIELIYTFYRLFGWGIRQITGYVEDLWKSRKLNIPVPSFGHLSDLFASLPMKTKQYCDKLSKRVKNGEAVTLIVDSSGMKFDHASDWYYTKYNKPCKRKPWRKMHIAIDPDMNMRGLQITEETTADIHEVDNLLAAAKSNIAVNTLLGDGGYYCKDMSESLIHQGITPVIPPPKHSVVTGDQDHPWHNKIVQYIKDKGTVYAFHKKYGYGQRSLVEAQFSRIKRCLGERLLTHKLASQKNEGIVIGNIINLWNSFGKCHAVKIDSSKG